MKILLQKNRGFTAYFAILVSTIALSIGLTIYDLLIRELSLSQTALQSEYAIFAADTGAECALYWDSKAPSLNGSPSVFGTSSVSNWGGSPINCNSLDITVKGPPAMDLTAYSGSAYGCTSSSQWCITASAVSATTTFSLTFSPQNYCAVVVVTKYRDPSDPNAPVQTSVVSRGYNTCIADPNRLERSLQVNY